MLTLYITRHGETVWNTQKRMQGWLDSALTEKGMANAVSLGGSLRDIEFDAIYASPSERTVSTAKLIMGDRELPFYLEEQLREIHMGDWEGRTATEIQEQYPEEFHSFWNAPHLYETSSGESFEDLKTRVLQAVQSIREKHETGKILVVTHTVVIKTLLASFKNQPAEKLWEPPYIHDTSLTIVELDGENCSIVVEGDMSHLECAVKN
ncbi:histidine phosphatase family protein [Mesobacillus subterraneus]|uniref:histidine phosphatase family protein n=1 Tax=Mesobacillus subterraneus TaxID=285983 RepID=UPI00268B3E24